jgi:HicB family.
VSFCKVRLTSDLHYKAVLAAKTMGTTLNGFVKKAVEDELKKVSLI